MWDFSDLLIVCRGESKDHAGILELGELCGPHKE